MLNILLGELITVTKESGRGFATYVSDLLNTCKLQKTVLHCTLASVYNARLRRNDLDNQDNQAPAEDAPNTPGVGRGEKGHKKHKQNTSEAVLMDSGDEVPFTEVILDFNRECADFNTNDNTFQVCQIMP
jgi:hypothetical protein